MNRAFFILLLLLAACSRQASWRPPAYKEIEVCLNEYHLGPHNGAAISPNSELWRDPAKPGSSGLNSFSGSTGRNNGTDYKVEVTYLGPEKDGDRYRVNLTHPDPERGSKEEVFHVVFRGLASELWRDNAYSLEIRLKTP